MLLQVLRGEACIFYSFHEVRFVSPQVEPIIEGLIRGKDGLPHLIITHSRAEPLGSARGTVTYQLAVSFVHSTEPVLGALPAFRA